MSAPRRVQLRAGIRRAAPATWALAARLAGLVASTAIAMVLARSLGTDQFGRFSVASSIAVGGSIGVSGGLNRAALRDVASRMAHQEPGAAQAVIAAACRAFGIVAPLGAVATAFVGSLVLGWGTTVALAAMLALVLGLLLVVADVLRALGDYKIANVASGPSGGALVALGFLLPLGWSALRPTTADAALVVNLVAAMVASALAVGVLVVRTRKVTATEASVRRGATPARLLHAGLPFMVTQVALFLSLQVDLWIAGATLSEEDTGLYAAALRLMNVIRVPLTAAQFTLLAAIPALHALGRMRELERRVRRAALIVTVPSAVGLVACAFLAGPMLSLVLGEGYRGAAPLLVTLALGQLVIVALGLSGNVLNLCGFERLMLVVSVSSLAASVLADFVAARLWGVEALAVASASTTAGSFVALWWLAHHHLGIWTHPLWPTMRNLVSSGERSSQAAAGDPS
ncbi:MAG: oligosaccharide flippase family protein [Acidimicrobiales bacterium]